MPIAAAGGLYDSRYEHDACGVGFVVHSKGRRSHRIVEQALQVLQDLQQRGACGCESNTGDGAGILIQTPDTFLRRVAPATLPAAGEYGVGLVFLPQDRGDHQAAEALVSRIVAEEGQQLLGWRDVPTNDGPVGPSAIAVEPVFKHLFIGRSAALTGVDARLRFERKLYVIRKRIEHEADTLPVSAASKKLFYIVSLSANTLIYKGMLTAGQIETMFPDLTDPDIESALALV